MRKTFLLITLLPLGTLWAGLEARNHYQPIIDAKPFGDMATSANTDTATLAEQQKEKEEIAQKFRMCGITDTPEGERKIAFIDETNGSPVTTLIGVGETQNGFTLITADYEAEHATLKKGELTFTLGLGVGLIDSVEAPKQATESQQSEAAPIKFARTARSKVPSAKASSDSKTSFRARLLKRQGEEADAKSKETQALQRRVAEAEASTIQAKRRIQIERIKQGLAPTEPITLTAEEDAELQAAGVFNENRTTQEQPVEESEAQTEHP